MKMARGQTITRGADIARLRLRNSRLIGTTFSAPEQVVGWLGAVQSQEYTAAKWGLAQRMKRGTDAVIEAAFERGDILRTHVLRPTWHFVTPADIRWLLKLTAPRVRTLLGYYDRKLEIDPKLLQRSAAVLERALVGANRTREELGSALADAGIEARGQRLAHLLAHAELDALICSGPRRGKQFTYALVDERAPAAPRRERDEALADLARRYFQSHGPALVQDFAWWSGLTVGDAKRAIALADPKLDQLSVEDKQYWFVPPLPAAGGARSERPIVQLLPAYDEQVASFKDYAPSFDPERVRVPRNADGALMNHILVSNGQVIGGWKRTLGKDEVRIEVKLLAKLTAAERAGLERAAEQYGEFVGLPPRLESSVVKSLGRLA